MELLAGSVPFRRGETDRIVGRDCPLCGDTGRERGGARECCGCLLSWTWPSESAYEDWYRSGTYHTEEQSSQGQATTALRDTEHQRAAVSRLRIMEALGLSGSLLDIGAAMGSFVAAASTRGWEAIGVEPCAEMVRQAQALGRPVIIGSSSDLPGSRFDVVTCHDVLEHLTRPHAALLAMKSRLQSDGCLVVEMPEYLAPCGDWSRHIRPRQHVCLYTERAARELFDQCGFTIEAMIRPLRGDLAKAAYYLRAD